MSVFPRTQYATESFAQLGTDIASRTSRKQRSFGGLGFDLDRFGSLQLSYGQQIELDERRANETIGAQPLGARCGALRLPELHREPHDQRRGRPRTCSSAGRCRSATAAPPRRACATRRMRSMARSSRPSPRCSRACRRAGHRLLRRALARATTLRGYALRATPAWSASQYARRNGMDGWRVDATRRPRDHRRRRDAGAAARPELRRGRGGRLPGHDGVRREPAGRPHGQEGPRAARLAARLRAQLRSASTRRNCRSTRRSRRRP